MLKSAFKSYFFRSPDFMSRPFCSHVAMLQGGGKFGRIFCKQTSVAACRFQNECNKVEIALRVVQFWSEIKLVIANRTPASRSCDFVITRLISDQIALHSVQLALLTIHHPNIEDARATHSRYYKHFAKHACDFLLILLKPCNFLYKLHSTQCN